MQKKKGDPVPLAMFLVILVTAGSGLARILPEEVSVLVNENSPESRLVGRFYQQLRHIPPPNMIFIHAPDREAISRREYRDQVEKRVRQFLAQKTARNIKYLVTTRGLPLLIYRSNTRENTRPGEDFSTDAASLESELMNVLRSRTVLSGWKKRLPAEQEEDPASREIIAMRLDGPGVVEIKRYLNAGFKAEHEGLKGYFCIDSAGNAPAESPFYYYDRSLVLLADNLKNQVKNLGVRLNRGDGAFALQDCSNPALYTGWPAPVPGKSFTMKPGALGFMITVKDSISFVKSPKGLDAAGMIQSGASHTLGPVSPPFLTAFPVPHHFFPLVLGGRHDMGEVVKLTAPHSSWMITYIGDPMYCPFEINPQLDIDEVEKWLRKPLETK